MPEKTEIVLLYKCAFCGRRKDHIEQIDNPTSLEQVHINIDEHRVCGECKTKLKRGGV